MNRLAAPLAALTVTIAAFSCGRRDALPPDNPGPPSPSARPVAASEPARAASEPLPPRFGFGHAATSAEIRAWDIDVMPDGTGLPPGRGTVAAGATLYAAQCAVCHGPDGKGGQYDILVGREPGDRFPFGKDPALLTKRTIGNYWPYATTLYDYIYRAMPQAVPGSLTPDEVYSLVAYLLFLNGIVPEDAVMTAQTLPKVEMPARKRFVLDNRRGGPEIR
jgi:S-disulfanyl-L-cysteine oxidoreductase SoxD